MDKKLLLAGLNSPDYTRSVKYIEEEKTGEKITRLEKIATSLVRFALTCFKEHKVKLKLIILL